MARIRHFTIDDIPAVADLFQLVFRKKSEPAPESMRKYFLDLYFNNPWYDERISSSVFEAKGSIRGFIGVVPFDFMYNGKRLRAAIAGNHMVHPSLHDPFAGINLLKNLFAGPQDLTFSDTANEISRILWSKLGATTLPAYGLQWLRVLSPARFATSLLKRNKALSSLNLLLRPFSIAGDFFTSLPSRSIFSFRPSGLTAGVLDETILLEGISMVSTKMSIVPTYSRESLGWLLGMADVKEEFGKLHRVSLNGKEGELVGWYLFYANPGGIGQVLQFGARPGHNQEVLQHLFWDAAKQGCIALAGRARPSTLRDLSSQYCALIQRGHYVQAHAADLQILHALNGGDAFFTRLEGEWWTRLQGDQFQ